MKVPGAPYRLTDPTGGEDAAVLATSEVGAVLAGTTATNVAGFALVVFSFVTWGAQAAIVTIPTLAAAFLASVLVLPPLVGWHAVRNPEQYDARRRPGPLDDVDA